MKAFTPTPIVVSRRRNTQLVWGFTLVEIMVTLLISSLMFTALFIVLSSGRNSWYIGDAQVRLNEEMRKPLLTINKELRQSRPSEITGVPADDNFYTSITFKVPEDTDNDGDVIDAAGNVEWSENITYALNANNQIVRSAPSGTSVLANNISSLQFRRPSGNPSAIQIYITANTTTVSGRNLQSNIMSSVNLRN